jgi:hypothetical protein
MVGSGQVQEPHKGCFGRSALRCGPGEARRRPIDTLRCGWFRRVTVRFHQARERRPGEVLGKVFAGITLEGQNPGEAPAVVGLKNRAVARQSQRYEPGNRRSSGRSGALCGGIKRRANGTQVLPGRKAADACGRGNLRRVNPKSAAGVKQNWHGIRGRKPSRG